MTDDDSISDNDLVYRRINPEWMIWDDDPPRITSAAFQNMDGDKMSANLQSILEDAGQSVDDLIRDWPGYGVAAISVRKMSELGQSIELAPESNDISHIHVVGKKSRSIKKKLAASASDSVWVYPRKTT
ncbi:MAG: hypothetical protein RIA65_03975 [Woeseia sp.]